MMGLEQFHEWLALGETGMSSLAMVKAVTGCDGFLGRNRHVIGTDHPYDSADLMRCLRLVDAVPGIRDHFDKIAVLSPEWAAIIDRFPELERIAMVENPDWREDPRWHGSWDGPLNRHLRLLIGSPT